MMLPEQMAREWPSGWARSSPTHTPAATAPRDSARGDFCQNPSLDRGKLKRSARRPGEGWCMSDQSTTVLEGYLQRAMSGDAAARQRLLEVTRDRLMRHARR